MEKILLVDDVATNLKCVSKSLKDKYQFITAKSGEEALMLMKKEKPDLILLDICMPNMDGYEVLKRIKADVDGANIPVVFLTAESNLESEMKGRELGAADFIRKPFMPSALFESIQAVLEQNR
ncbi:MAG: response regulator [Lachnospiraceae bacterium]|nr:response regulator [Lachnospiraceae bacterium]